MITTEDVKDPETLSNYLNSNLSNKITREDVVDRYKLMNYLNRNNLKITEKDIDSPEKLAVVINRRFL